MIVVRTLFKIVLLGLALLAGEIAGGMIAEALLHPPAMAMTHDGPFDLTQALLLMTAAYALALALYAARLRGGFISRTAALFAILYVTGSALSVIETVYFNSYVKLPIVLLEQTALTSLIQAPVAAPVAAALWRGAARRETPER